jgi:hypothetical protein
MDATDKMLPGEEGKPDDKDVEEVYNSQKKLEEEGTSALRVTEEEEELLAKGPGEDDNSDVSPDILDVTMEDAGLEGTTTAVPNPNTGGKVTSNIMQNTNPTRGVKGSQIILAPAGTTVNPIEGDGSAGDTVNPSEGTEPANAKTSNMLNK